MKYGSVFSASGASGTTATMSSISGLLVTVQGVVLALVGAFGGSEFDRFGLRIDCEVEGWVGRLFAVCFGLLIVVLGIGVLIQDRTDAAAIAALVAAGMLVFVAVADGEFTIAEQTVASHELNLLGRLYLAALALVLVFSPYSSVWTRDILAVPIGLLLLAAFAALAACVDELKVLGFTMGDAEAPTPIRAVIIVMSVLLVLASPAAASRAKRASKEATIATSPTAAAIQVTAASGELRPSQRFVQLASSTDEAEAGEIAQNEATEVGIEVCVFLSTGQGNVREYYACSLGPLERNAAADLLAKIKERRYRTVDRKAFVALGDQYQRRTCYHPSTSTR